MNMYLLNLISKWVGVVMISTMSIFGLYSEKTINVSNENTEINLNIINYIEKHNTKIIYNAKLPSNITKVVTEGVDGITYNVLTEETEKPKILQTMVTEVLEKGTGAYGVFTGRLTGYSPECEGCSPAGNVACYTKDKKKFSLKSDGIYYKDEEFGNVYILAAAAAKFPCGTIMKITKTGVEPYYAVVMDRGNVMNYQWSIGSMYADLAFSTNKDAYNTNLTGKNVKFEVQRWGW